MSVDRDASGAGTPVYNVGDPVTVAVRSSEAGYVYLFNVRSSGEVVQLLPNRLDAAGGDNAIAAGATRTFPPPGARYAFTVDGPDGLDRVTAVVSKTPLDTEAVFDKIGMSAFEGTPLDTALRDCGVRTFLIVGVATEIGIEPTIRQGADLGYIPVLIEDACGAGDEEAAQRAIVNLRHMGDTMFTTVNEVTALLRAARRHT